MGRMWHKVTFFKWSTAGLNSEFSFFLLERTKTKVLGLPYYLRTAWDEEEETDKCFSQ